MKYLNTHKRPQTIWLIVIGLVALAALIFSVIEYIHDRETLSSRGTTLTYDDDKKIADIEAYLDTLSPKLIPVVQAMAKESNLPSWGCGPTSYAVAKLINQKFFDDNLSINGTYRNSHYEIVERFRFAIVPPAGSGLEAGGIDHNWIEVYLNDKFIFIDPTIGQFGRYNKIVYEVFTIGDPTISNTLQEKYGIGDMQVKVLLKKSADRVPKENDPYAGYALSAEDIPYYMKVIDTQNDVNSGIEPEIWKSWVDALIKKVS